MVNDMHWLLNARVVAVQAMGEAGIDRDRVAALSLDLESLDKLFQEAVK